MTRPYALRRLLEHGPLGASEILAITGWPRRAMEYAIQALDERGEITVCGRAKNGYVYRLV